MEVQVDCDDLDPYCVVKFNEDDDICYEGAPVIWIETFVEDNLVKVWWPPIATKVSSWAANQKLPDSSWTLCEGEIVKYCDSYKKARQVADGFVGNSNYETDHGEVGRGKPRRSRIKKPVISSSESENEETTKKKDVAPPPAISVPDRQLKPTAGPSQKVKIVSGKKSTAQRKTASQPVLTREEQMTKLKEKIIQERQKAVEKQGVKRKNENFVPPTQSQPGKYVMSPYKVVVIDSKDSDDVLEKDNNGSNNCEPVKRNLFSSEVSSKQTDSGPGLYVKSPKKMRSDYQTIVSNALRPESSSFMCDDGSQGRDGLNSSIAAQLHSNSGGVDVNHLGDEDVTHSFFEFENHSGGEDVFHSGGEEEVGNSSLDNVSSLKASTPTEKSTPSKAKSVNRSKTSKSPNTGNRQEQLLEEISSKVDIILMNQFKTNKALMPHEKRIQRPPNLPSIPLRTMKSFKHFEEFLNDDANLSAASYYFASLPMPKGEKGAVNKLMPRLMGNEIAVNFNFDGKGDKTGFQFTKMWESIQGALCLKYEGSDLNVAIQDMRSWLRNAKGRKTSDPEQSSHAEKSSHREKSSHGEKSPRLTKTPRPEKSSKPRS